MDYTLNDTSEQEVMKILYTFNQTKKDYDIDKKIHQLLEEMALCRPQETALKSGNTSFTYSELNSHANQLANALIQQGVKDKQIIGILVDRSPECIIAIYGVLKAGCTYLPIDVEYPLDRINYILNDSKVSVLLTNEEINTIEFSGKLLNIKKELTKNYDKENMIKPISSESLAYVIYTSGTTGNPKGIMVTHRAVHNFIIGISEIIPFKEGKKFVSLTTMAFDMFVVEGLVALSNGMQVIMANREEQKNPSVFKNLVERENISYISTTPSRIKLFLSTSSTEGVFAGFDYILMGGESIPQKVLDLLTKSTKASVYNLYGPTETTVYSTIHKVRDTADNNIGKPIRNTRIYILDKDNNEQPVGVPGEICIAGDGVTKGYINNESLTREKYIDLPRLKETLVYRTGDIGQWLPNGEIELWGRIDNQVKIRGYRIELDEIDTCLMQHKDIVDCTTIDRTDSDGNKYLCSYVVSDSNVSSKEIRNYLSLKVPEYMVPSFIIQLDEIPMNTNGKINRQALPEPIQYLEKNRQIVLPQNVTERKVLNIMSDVLGINNLSITDDFFDMGGHSLKVAEFINRISDELQIQLNFKELFGNTTPQQIADLCFKKTMDNPASEISEILHNKYGLNAVSKTLIYSESSYNLLYIEGTEKNRTKEVFNYLKSTIHKTELPNYIFWVNDISNEVELMSYQIELDKRKADDTIQEKLKDIMTQLDAMDSEYGSFIQSVGIGKTYGFSPLQCINLEIENQFSGTLIRMDEAIDIPIMTQAFLMLLQSQSTLRNAYNESGIIEYCVPNHIRLPFLDLSEYSVCDQKVLKEEVLKHYIMKAYGYESILHRVLLIKENLLEYSFLMPVHSIIFDGMSVAVLHKELLANYRYLSETNNECKGNKQEEFSEYVLQIQKGPVNVTKEEIIQKYELRQYNELAGNIKLDNNSEEFYIEYDMDFVKTYNVFNNLWELTLYLVLQFYQKYFNMSQIPVALFVLGREFEEKTFFNSIGNYVTYIPTILEGTTEDMGNLSNKIKDQIEFAGKNNIHFPAIIMNEQIQEKYQEVLQLLFSNFEAILMLGHQDHVTEETIALNNLIGQWNTSSIDAVGNRIIDVMCSNQVYRMSFTGFKGFSKRKSEIMTFLMDTMKNCTTLPNNE